MKPARSPLWGRAVAACALLAAFALLSGMTGGLARFGLPLPVTPAPVHGALMLCAFFGTLIALERAVALQRLAGLLAPLLAGVGGVLAQVPVLLPLARQLFVAAVALIAFGVSGVLPFALWSGCALLAVWLLRWDIAPRAWSAAGWPESCTTR